MVDLLDSHNVVRVVLEPGGTDPLTRLHRDGCRVTGVYGVDQHTVCVVAAKRKGRSHSVTFAETH